MSFKHHDEIKPNSVPIRTPSGIAEILFFQSDFDKAIAQSKFFRYSMLIIAAINVLALMLLIINPIIPLFSFATSLLIASIIYLPILHESAKIKHANLGLISGFTFQIGMTLILISLLVYSIYLLFVDIVYLPIIVYCIVLSFSIIILGYTWDIVNYKRNSKMFTGQQQ